LQKRTAELLQQQASAAQRKGVIRKRIHMLAIPCYWGYNDHRIAKSIKDSIDFAAKRQVWRRMIQKSFARCLLQ